MSTVSNKQKTLDNVFQTMKGKRGKSGGPETVIAYGAAKFSFPGKNKLSVPATSVFRRCGKQFRVRLLDEYRTTKACHRCNHILGLVMVNNGIEIR